MSSDVQLVSAQVILISGNKASSDNAAITAENISQFLPSKESIVVVTKEMAKLGFETGGTEGISFSITAPARIFEKVFKVKILIHNKKGIKCKWQDGTVKDYLPVSVLPESIAKHINQIVFPAPPEFGPGNF